MRSIINTLLIVTLTVAQIVGSMAHAQSLAPDAEPPVIELEEIDSSDVAGDQVFLAQVVDDRELLDVILYHRRAGQQAYTRSPMLAVGASSFYRGVVESDTTDLRDIEYYVQARDLGGNRAVVGFAFDPLVRRFDSRLAASTEQVQVGAADSSVASGTLTTRSPVRWWHVAVGVLAVGALAAAAGGGGSDGGDRGTVPLTINLGEPL